MYLKKLSKFVCICYYKIMSFKDWLFSRYPAQSKVQAWGLAHILTLVACIGITIALAFLFKNKSKKAKNIVLWVLVGLILFFEIARRIIIFCSTSERSLNFILYVLLPRPWCAISCWALIIARIFNKKYLYNFASISALLCAIIFFAYPGVGFRAPYFLFEDLYSVVTHCLLLITSISLMTLGFTNFRYKKFWKVAVCYAVILAYAFLEIYVLKIEHDPMYFMPNNDVQEIVGLSYPVFLIIYIAFILFYFNLFPLIQHFKDKRKRLKNKEV